MNYFMTLIFIRDLVPVLFAKIQFLLQITRVRDTPIHLLIRRATS